MVYGKLYGAGQISLTLSNISSHHHNQEIAKIEILLNKGELTHHTEHDNVCAKNFMVTNVNHEKYHAGDSVPAHAQP